MKKIKLYKPFYLAFIVVFAFTFNQAFGQIDGRSISNSGSFYSQFGVGFPSENNTARELSLGISGVSLDNSQSISLSNPALWGKNSYTTTSSGFQLSQHQSVDNTSESINSNLQAGYLQLTLPIIRERFGVSASLYPATRSNYRYFSTSSMITSENETIEYAYDITGKGGINKFEVGFGWNINKNIAIGYAPSLAFITQENSQELFFNQQDLDYNYTNSKISGSAFSHRFGALLTFRNLLKTRDKLSIGSSFNLPLDISTKEQIVSAREVNGQTRDVILDENIGGNARLPLEVNAGLSYYPSYVVNFSIEGKLQQWSEAQSNISTNNQSFELSDRAKLGLGGEYHPYRTNSTSFFSNFRYSGGISYDSGHLKSQNHDINTLWFSAGLGIISPFSNSSIGLSAQYGLRGTTSDNLIKEKIWAFNLSVNLTEFMFRRPKLN
ncbi:MAG: hypothetical protein HUJ22_11705 [Gracilimonas sp.]|uniref:hypothetical protein n=1 Tax=Gracilimonas sp. TaxID=1974203 RepID=UPI0019A912C1|nr:hypothetical protein [Gracilimonas sp.]MBD3617225.1 hypothetical protein [Gracilimonas sp.]